MFMNAAIDGNRARAERNVLRDAHPAPPERRHYPDLVFDKHFVPMGRSLARFLPRCLPRLLPRSRWMLTVKLIVVLLCALALKYFYSTASVNELRWILAPT